MNLEPIGIVRSPVAEGGDADWGGIVAEVVIEPGLAAGLRGLDQFSHVIVVFFMYGAGFDPATDLVRRPRGRADMPEVGCFAQRAKHRPNPIGLSTVRLLAVE